MKKHTLILILFLFTLTSFSQSRTSPTIAKVVEKSEKLTKATGWVKNRYTLEWIDNQNCLYDKKCNSSWASHAENFLWIQTWKLEMNGTTYFAIVSEVLSGYYRYPTIRKEWKSWKVTKWLILTEADYVKFKDQINELSALEIIVKSKMNSELNDLLNTLGGDKSYTEDNIIKLISASIQKENNSLEAYKLTSQTVDGIDIVRFRLQSNYYESSIFHFPNDLEDQYFEVSLEEFAKIFIDKS